MGKSSYTPYEQAIVDELTQLGYPPVYCTVFHEGWVWACFNIACKGRSTTVKTMFDTEPKSPALVAAQLLGGIDLGE